MNEIKTTIIKRIHEEKIKMKPKWHFVLKGSLLFFSITALILVLIYLFSFLILFLNSENFVKMPLHELRDYIRLTEGLPWVIILFSVVGFCIVETLVSKYEFAHRKPFLYSLIIVFLIVAISGFLLSDKKYHAPIQQYPPFNRMYDRYNMRDKSRGESIEIIQIRMIEPR